MKFRETVQATPALAKTLKNGLQALKSWLKTNAPRLNALPREFVWVASGMVAVQPGSPQRKKLAECGLVFAGSRFIIKTFP